MLSILITHYNRPAALSKVVKAFREIESPVPVEIVVSDDASEQVIAVPGIDTLVVSPVNQGLAHNLNKGIRACRGDFILYCQEDYLPLGTLPDRLPELLGLLRGEKVDMVRLAANYTFPKTLPLSDNARLIPRFHLKNFFFNQFRYSDNPFIVRRDFFDRFGYYLENTNAHYGENEYAIRMMRSPARIAITTEWLLTSQNAQSVNDAVRQRPRFKVPKLVHKTLRSLRHLYEAALYDAERRGLKTYKNTRSLLHPVNTEASPKRI